MPARTAPFGFWDSPLAAHSVAAASVRFADLRWDGNDLYWREGRRSEGGRAVIRRCGADGSIATLTPDGCNVRTLVHEYGGQSFAVADGLIVFSNLADQQLYRQKDLQPPVPVTAPGAMRYADGVIDTPRKRLICVREDHGKPDMPVNALVSVDLERDAYGEVLFGDSDFVAAPALSPRGDQLAWISWNHPNMAFQKTTLWLADLDSTGRIAGMRAIADNPSESILEPRWSPDGILHFVSDRTGWWNLHRWTGNAAEAVAPLRAEFSAPLWFLGLHCYGFAADGTILAAVNVDGIWSLRRLPPGAAEWTVESERWVDLAQIGVSGSHAAFLGATPDGEQEIVQFDPVSGATHTVTTAGPTVLEPEYISRAEPIAFESENGATAHGFYYAPANPYFTGPPGEKPPLIVMAHGGPHYATSMKFDSVVQFYTTRGFAVLDVNYAGSNGFGRAYRDRLWKRWGMADVQDCEAGARALVRHGLADGNRLIIRGESAGGYIVLRALTESDAFRAGSSHYGPADLERLLLESHKLEASYPLNLIGPWPEDAALYRARSPLHNAEKIKAALIIFQGAQDKVVPPEQSRRIAEAARRSGAIVEYHEFANEAHGFRAAAALEAVLNAELAFFRRVIGAP